MITNLELIKFAKSKIGTPYVYGMKGEVMTSAKYAILKNLYKDLVWDSDIRKVNKVCVDCSGLISWATHKIRGSSQFKEMAKEVHPISTISKAPLGVAVWRQGHIGIYIGNGEYIAADGSAYGVRINKLSKTNFTQSVTTPECFITNCYNAIGYCNTIKACAILKSIFRNCSYRKSVKGFCNRNITAYACVCSSCRI